MKKKKQGLLIELWHARTVRIWTFCAAGLLLLAIILLFFVVRPTTKDSGIVPEAIVKIANFTPYFYEGSIPATFTTGRANVSYVSNVLLIRLTNAKNQTVVMTQQALPSDLAGASIQGEAVEGAPGEAIIAVGGSHTTATLLTNDKKTMVILTTSDAIDRSSLKELLRGLKPLR